LLVFPVSFNPLKKMSMSVSILLLFFVCFLRSLLSEIQKLLQIIPSLSEQSLRAAKEGPLRRFARQLE